MTGRRGAEWTGGGQSHSCTVLPLLPPARHLGYDFLPVCGPSHDRRPSHRQEAARILRNEVCNRSDDGNPPLELSERTEQILASRDWLRSRRAEPAFSLR